MKNQVYLLAFILCFTSAIALGNTAELPLYKIRRMSPAGGLGMNGQRDVQQDNWNFIWVITVQDLYRFDGYTFKRYTDKLHMQDTGFERLEIDKAGNIYVAMYSGLLKYNPLTDNFDMFLDKRCNLVKEDFEGRLWVNRNTTIGFYNFKTKQWMPVESEHGAISNVTAICTNATDVYIGTITGEVYALDSGIMKFERIFSKQGCDITDMALLDSSLYILSEHKGLFTLNVTDYKETKHYNFFYPGGDTRVSARSLFIDKFKHVWITGQRGIYMMDPSTDRYVHYQYDKTDIYSMPSSSVWRISEDSQGNLWFGTYSGGLCYINLDEQKSFQSYNGLTDGLSFPVVSSFAEQDSCIWIGTEGGGLNKFDKNTNTFTHYKHQDMENSLSYDNIQALLLTGNRDLWIGMSRGGMDCLDTKNGQFTHYQSDSYGSPVLNNHVAKLINEGDSGIWIKYLAYGSALTYMRLSDRRFEHIDFSRQSLINLGIVDIARGNDDMLWIASPNRLFVLDVSNRNRIAPVQVDSDSASEFQNMTIQTIYADRNNNEVLLGTSKKGLVKYNIKDNKFSVCADLSKYDVNYILSINRDEKGYIWLGTDNGLFRYDTETQQLLQFNSADGAQGRNYYNFATFRSQTGEIFMGGNEGFTVINPLQITRNTYKPHVIISEFFLDNVPVTPNMEQSPLQGPIFQAKKLKLKHNQNNFRFEFSSSNYLNPDKNRFKYMLKGYDARWIETDATHRIANYSKVPKGKYAFQIMTANNDGEWGEDTTLNIIILPSPWMSPFALSVYFLLVVTAIYGIIRYFNNQRKLKMKRYLEEREREQKEAYHQEQLQFFTNVSHDFRTPLSLILTALEPVKAGNNTAKYLSILENNIRRLLNLVNEIMDLRSLQNKKVRLGLQISDWNHFVETCCSDFFEYASQKEIRFLTNFDDSMPGELYFDGNVMEKIILNLLNNAFKYTDKKGEIKVSTLADIDSFHSAYAHSYIAEPNDKNEKMFGLVISDTGVGISKTSIGRVFERYYRTGESDGTPHLGSGIGLALVKSLVELHRGNIILYSERDIGTDIVIGFPIDRNTYPEEAFFPDNLNSVLSENYFYMDEPANGKYGEITKTEKEVVFENRKNILLVEDNAELRELLSDELSEYYEVKMAETGLAALKLLDEEDIDLIITDIMMPEMDGIALCKKVKEQMDISHIPVVMLTAKTGAENKIEGLYSGADAYLEKPVNKKLLLLTLTNIFKQQMRIREYYSKQFYVDNTDISLNKSDLNFMKKLMETIDSNISNPELDVVQIASALAMSHRKLYGKVKAMTGHSVVEFIRDYRINKAARMLIENNITVSMVMEQVGINNLSYFSRIFKKKLGKSPSEFIAKRH